MANLHCLRSLAAAADSHRVTVSICNAAGLLGVRVRVPRALADVAYPIPAATREAPLPCSRCFRVVLVDAVLLSTMSLCAAALYKAPVAPAVSRRRGTRVVCQAASQEQKTKKAGVLELGACSSLLFWSHCASFATC